MLKGGALADSRRSAGRTRLGRRTLIAALALDATAAATPVAAAQAPDPMTTNIPYTAWAGTQLRLVKCSNDLEGLSRRGLDVLVEEWSGSDNYRPQVVDTSIDYVRSSKRDDQRCARFNVVSNGDGIARIKLKAFDDNRNEALEHQFLAIWMRLGTPSIDEVGAADPTGGPAGSATVVGDPAGDGAFLPSSKNGRVQVTVTGTFPGFDGATMTLPDDWAALAALESNEDPARWDIHDDTLKTEAMCPASAAASRRSTRSTTATAAARSRARSATPSSTRAVRSTPCG